MHDGSLSGAARRLGLTQPTVGRHIDALEAALGLTLFTRSPRGLAPTTAALALAPHVEAMAASAAALARTASGEAAADRGVVRVTASEIIGCEVLPPILAAFRAEHPGIAVELALTNRNEDLARRDADIAVRMVRPTQSALARAAHRRFAHRPLCPPRLSRALREAALARRPAKSLRHWLRSRQPLISRRRRLREAADARRFRLPLRQRSRAIGGAARRRRHRRLPGEYCAALARTRRRCCRTRFNTRWKSGSSCTRT